MLLRRLLLVDVEDVANHSASHCVNTQLLKKVSLLSMSDHLLVLEVVKVLLEYSLVSVWQFLIEVFVIEDLALHQL